MFHLIPVSTTTDKLNQLCEGRDVSDKRKESLRIAIESGSEEDTLKSLRDAMRLHRNGSTIILPAGRYENLSRGRGWARKGKRDAAQWGDRVDGGYKCDAGNWTIGCSDGFSRKDEVKWTVKNIKVGEQTWTIAD